MTTLKIALTAEQVVAIKLSLEQSGYCPSSDLIGDYVMGIMPAALKGPIAEHFRKCKNCRLLLELDELAITHNRRASTKSWCS